VDANPVDDDDSRPATEGTRSMSHVLLCGSAPLLNEVHAHLSRWGMTVERLLEAPGGPGPALLSSCDALVVACDDCESMSWCPNQLAKSESSAPMLLVGGGPGRRTCRQNCWVNIERISPEGRNLRQALETCLARSEQLRRKSEELNGYQDYLQFLSHELKTPLTAAQTALQLLLGEADDVSDARRREFLDIALRNLRRLGNTITWSEDYLNDRMAPAAPNWSRQGAGSLIVELVRSGDDDELAVECDAAVG
jgi:hypothetical protein